MEIWGGRSEKKSLTDRFCEVCKNTWQDLFFVEEKATFWQRPVCYTEKDI